MKRNLIIGGAVAAVLLIAFFVVNGNKSSETVDILTNVK
jgi:hypothetical protein